MEVCHEIAKSLNTPSQFLADPEMFVPICSHPSSDGTEHKSQLVCIWQFDSQAVPSLQVCCVVSVWASVWARRCTTKVKQSGGDAKSNKKAARHLVGFGIPALSCSRLRVAPLQVDPSVGDGLTYKAVPETLMQVSEHN